MFNKSFTLIEVVVAIFILTMGTMGAFSLIQRTFTFTLISSSQLKAAYLAQEGVEIVRNIRDSNYLAGVSWDTGLVGCSSGCEADYNDIVLSADDRFLKFDNAFYNYSAGDDTFYKRKITITPGIDLLEVAVEVSWQERGGSHQLTVQSELYNWR